MKTPKKLKGYMKPSDWIYNRYNEITLDPLSKLSKLTVEDKMFEAVLDYLDSQPLPNS